MHWCPLLLLVLLKRRSFVCWRWSLTFYYGKSQCFTTTWGEHELFSPTTLSKSNIFVHVSFLRIESLKRWWFFLIKMLDCIVFRSHRIHCNPEILVYQPGGPQKNQLWLGVFLQGGPRLVINGFCDPYKYITLVTHLPIYTGESKPIGNLSHLRYWKKLPFVSPPPRCGAGRFHTKHLKKSYASVQDPAQKKHVSVEKCELGKTGKRWASTEHTCCSTTKSWKSRAVQSIHYLQVRALPVVSRVRTPVNGLICW